MPKDLHVLVLSSWYPEHNHSRNGLFVMRQAEAIAAVGLKTGIIAAVAADVSDYRLLEQEEGGVPHVVVYYPQGDWLPVQAWRYFRAFLIAWKQYCVNFGKPNVLLNMISWRAGTFCLWLHYRYNLPYMYFEHWSAYLSESGYTMSYAVRYFSSLLAARAEQVGAVSQHLALAMEKRALASKVVVIPNVVNTEYFFARPNQERSRQLFVHVSNLASVKNLELLLTAFRKLRREYPEARLLVAGVYDVEWALAHYTGDMQGIDFIGAQSAESLAAIYRQATALLLSSFYETFSIVVPEALACGCPVISAELPAVKEHADLGRIIFVSDFSPENWCKHMEACIETQLNFIPDTEAIEKRYGKRQVGEAFKKLLQRIANVG
ncbi:MAG: glycosyltransferase family 4 protein [Bacteroidia bacterium]